MDLVDSILLVLFWGALDRTNCTKVESTGGKKCIGGYIRNQNGDTEYKYKWTPGII